MQGLTSEAFLSLLAVMGFTIVFGIIAWMMPTAINLMITSLESQVM